jgi:hypothetical protein
MPQNTVSSTICFSEKCRFIAANAASSPRAVIKVTASAQRTAAFCRSSRSGERM